MNFLRLFSSNVILVVDVDGAVGSEDFYKILGVEQNASPADIKKAFFSVRPFFSFLTIKMLIFEFGINILIIFLIIVGEEIPP